MENGVDNQAIANALFAVHDLNKKFSASSGCWKRSSVKKKRTWKKMSPEEVERQLENQRRFAEALVRMLERQGVSHEEAVRRAMAHD